jgi:hypothetical protein
MTDIASITSAFYSSQCIHRSTPPGDAQAWPCGSNQSAAVQLHQMLTLPCNTTGISGLDAFPFGLLGMACVGTTYVEICVAPWRFR